MRWATSSVGSESGFFPLQAVQVQTSAITPNTHRGPGRSQPGSQRKTTRGARLPGGDAREVALGAHRTERLTRVTHKRANFTDAFKFVFVGDME